MTWTLFLALLAGWVAGVLTGDTFGGGLHLLLLAAISLLVAPTLSNRRRARN